MKSSQETAWNSKYSKNKFILLVPDYTNKGSWNIKGEAHHSHHIKHQFYLDYCCLQCNEHVYYGRKGVSCSSSDISGLIRKVLACHQYKIRYSPKMTKMCFGFQDAVRNIFFSSMMSPISNFLTSWNQIASVLFKTILISPTLYRTVQKRAA